MDKDIHKNLKDVRINVVKDNSSPLPNLPLIKGEEQGGGLRYTKTSKLITALYMVTDIMDKDEPIRLKLRTSGLSIISDINSSTLERTVLVGRVSEIMSFLDIASAMNFISEMNCAILKKEFLELKASMQGYKDMKPTWLEDFFANSDDSNSPHPNPLLSKERGNLISKGHATIYNGHQSRTRIGVQKGSTLMQALSDKMGSGADAFNTLKKERRDSIINIIKAGGGSSTIKDIKTSTIAQGEALRNVSEKTLQRELLSMVKEGVLNKTGEKRWSRYFVK